MKHFLLIALLCILLVACGELPTATIGPTGTPTIESTQTPTPGSSQAPPTSTPTPAPNPTGSATDRPTPGIAFNFLSNPSFELGWRVQDNNQNWKVPIAWQAFWVPSVPPEFLPGSKDRYCGSASFETEAHPTHVAEGTMSARVIQAYSNCVSGLYQAVGVAPGALYDVNVRYFNWSTSRPIVDTPSESSIKVLVCADPAGGIDWRAGNVICSPFQAERDRFTTLTVRFRAVGATATIFLVDIPDYALARSDTFWDDAQVFQVGPPLTVTPTPVTTMGTPIIEVTPLGQIAPGGTILYSLDTNIRDCSAMVTAASPWSVTTINPYTCAISNNPGSMIPGTTNRFYAVAKDRNGNRWAWFSPNGNLVSLACGAPSAQRAILYPGVSPEIFDVATVRVTPVNPCDLTSDYYTGMAPAK